MVQDILTYTMESYMICSALQKSSESSRAHLVSQQKHEGVLSASEGFQSAEYGAFPAPGTAPRGRQSWQQC